MSKTYYVAINLEDENRFEELGDVALRIELGLMKDARGDVEAVVFDSAEDLLEATRSDEPLFTNHLVGRTGL